MKERMVSQRMVTFYLCMITLVIIAFALIIFLGNNASADTHWWDGGGGDNLWSTDANWNSTAGNDIEPIAGDNLYYWGGISTKSCTWDVAVTVGDITIAANYTGTVTQGAVDFGYGDFLQAAGVMVGSSKWQTCSGNFTVTGGSNGWTYPYLKFTGVGKTLNASSLSYFGLWFTGSSSITIIGNVVIYGGKFYIDAGSTVSVSNTKQIDLQFAYGTFDVRLDGIISGLGTVIIGTQGADVTAFKSSVIHTVANFNFVKQHWGAANLKISLGSDFNTTGTVTVITELAGSSITLDLGGKILRSGSLVVGNLGIIMSSVAGARIDAQSIVVQTNGHLHGQNIVGIIYSDPVLSVKNPNLYSYTATSNLTVKTWSKDSGNATWINVGSSNGSVWGIPPSTTNTMYYTISIKLLDYNSEPFYQNYTIYVYGPLLITSSEVTSFLFDPNWISEQFYTYNVTANEIVTWNLTTTFNWIYNSSITCLSIDNSGRIRSIPINGTMLGVYYVNISATNSNGTVYQNYSLVVSMYISTLETLALPLIFYAMCLIISLIGFRYGMTILSVVALIVSLLPIVPMLNLFGSYAYILLLFYLPLALIPIVTWRK